MVMSGVPGETLRSTWRLAREGAAFGTVFWVQLLAEDGLDAGGMDATSEAGSESDGRDASRLDASSSGSDKTNPGDGGSTMGDTAAPTPLAEGCSCQAGLVALDWLACLLLLTVNLLRRRRSAGAQLS